MSPISKLIMPFLYSTNFLEIVTNRYRYSFSLYSISNRFTILGIIWFLITLLSTIILNCLLYLLVSPGIPTRVGQNCSQLVFAS